MLSFLVVLSEVATFANASGIARFVAMFTVSGHLAMGHAVVASLALPLRVKRLVCVSAVGYLPSAYLLSCLLPDAT